MKKITKIIFAALLSLMLTFSSLYKVFADTLLTKTAELNKEENKVTIDINVEADTGNEKIPKVLVYQATYCKNHGLTDEIIIDSLNSLLTVADVDYYADAVHSISLARTQNQLKHFHKGDSINQENIYETINTAGTHAINSDCLDKLIEILNQENYNYLVMIEDGMAAAIYGINNDDSTIMIDDTSINENVKRIEEAAVLSNISILYLTSPIDLENSFLLFDHFFNDYFDYYEEKNKNSETFADRRKYLYIHNYYQALAFLAPKYYLTITDHNTGKINFDSIKNSSNHEIPFNKENFVYYDDATQVASKIDKITEYLDIAKTKIIDVLEDGLTYESSILEYYDEQTSTWEKVDETITDIKVNGQIITAVINSDEYINKKLHLKINTIPFEKFGLNGKNTNTNKECMVEYINDSDETIKKLEVESPTVKFTTFSVIYNEGKHGSITGITSENFKKNSNSNILSGSSVEAKTGYTFTGWICNKDVILTDGTNIKAGTLLTNEQIKMIIPTETITLTAQYEKLSEANNPKTLDSINTYLYVITIIISILGISVLTYKRKNQ